MYTRKVLFDYTRKQFRKRLIFFNSDFINIINQMEAYLPKESVPYTYNENPFSEATPPDSSVNNNNNNNNITINNSNELSDTKTLASSSFYIRYLNCDFLHREYKLILDLYSKYVGCSEMTLHKAVRKIEKSLFHLPGAPFFLPGYGLSVKLKNKQK